MPMMPKTHHALGHVPAVRAWKADYLRRGTRTSQGYSNRWLRARARWLAEHPLCARCLREVRVTAANVVDHIIPHRGDQVLFWDENNWQSLCKPCHNGPKRREEERARRACARGASGDPAPSTGGVVTETALAAEARPVANFCAREKARGGLKK
jgi:5-methylcytosine-specific restriction protein A